MVNSILRLGSGLCLAAALALATPAAMAAKVKGAGHFEIPSWFKQSFLDLREDVADAAAGGKRLLMYFHQDGCPYCAELINNNFSQRNILEYAQENFAVIDINMWGDREVTDMTGTVLKEKDFALKNKVWFTPTLLFFNEQGQVILRINGYYPPHRFLAALKYAGDRRETKMTFQQHMASLMPPPSHGNLHQQSFFEKPPYDLRRYAGDKLAVFFEQKDCPNCDTLHTRILTLPDTLAQVKRFKAVQLDMWSDTPLVTPGGRKMTAMQWAGKLGITYAPSVVLFDHGKEVIRMEAFLKAFHVQSVFDYAASGAYQSEPSLQRFIQARAERLLKQGKKVDIWK